MMFPNVGKKVLIWNNDCSPSFIGSGWADLRDLYQAMGLRVDVIGDLTGHSLREYQLIHFPLAVSNPSWWGEISGNTWEGRLHITAEHNDTTFVDFTPSIAYVNGLSGLTGIGVTGANMLGVFGTPGTAEPDDLTAGMTGIWYSKTSAVSGGTTLSNTVTEMAPWLARNKPGGSLIDFVVSGDIDHMVSGDLTLNSRLFQNMWNVPI